jgi:SAM-dependent methyltransferase
VNDPCTDLAASYSRTGAAWQEGPGRVYDVLAERTLAAVPACWRGRRVVDVGAGTGAMARAVRRAGGVPIATDLAFGMLTAAPHRAPSTVADARWLPVGAGAVDGWVAAFCLNHLDDAHLALREAVRVVRPGGPIVASSYAADDGHPVKGVVEGVATDHEWVAPAWAGEVTTRSAPRMATEVAALGIAERGGLVGARAVRLEIPFPDLDVPALVAWRTGMAQLAPWMATLGPREREAIVRDAARQLRDAPPLERRVVVLFARAA